MGCRKYVDGLLLAVVVFFLAIFVGMIFDSDTDISMKVFCAIMAAGNGALAWSLIKKLFVKKSSNITMPQNMANGLPVSPEMDHVDDMSMQ